MFKKIKYELLIFFIFVLSRLPDLGHDIFNTDVWKWKARTYAFGSGVFGLNFAETLQKYHPGVVLMWLGTFAVKFYNLYYDIFYGVSPQDNSVQTVFELHFVQKLFVVLTIGVVLSTCFYVLKNLFGIKYALFTSLLLILEPFYVALTRVFHLEGLMSAFMLAAFLWFYYYLEDFTQKKRFVISSIFTAFAVLTKTSALFLFPFMGIMLFLTFLQKGNSFVGSLRMSLKPYLLWLGTVAAIFALCWPAVWVIPLEVFKTLYRGIFTIGVSRGHAQLYFGRLTSNPGAGFYLVVFILRSSIPLLLGFLGYFLLVRKKADSKVLRFSSFVLLFCILYFIQLIIPSKKLDRYILPIFLWCVLLVGFFYTWLFDIFRRRGSVWQYTLSAVALYSIYTLVLIHPDYFSYFNPLVGGLSQGDWILESKWMIGHHELVDYFETLKASENLVDFSPEDNIDNVSSELLPNLLIVGFQEKYYTQIWPFIHEIGGRATIKDLTPHARKTKYFVYPVWDDEALLEDRFALVFLDKVYVRGVPIYNVYVRSDF